MTDQTTPDDGTPQPRPVKGKRASKKQSPSANVRADTIREQLETETLSDPEPDTAPDDVREDTVDDESLRRELIEELDRLVARVRQSAPDYTPPPFSPKRLLHILQENLQRF